MKIAVVEDEPKLASLLSDYLQKDGYEVAVHADGTKALQQLQLNLPDLILLDLMLPGTDGMTICREIRSHSNVPIIMMTAKVEEIDRLLGLELGADDYICKPYSPREVVARVKAVLRRTGVNEQPQTTDQFVLEEQTALVKIKGQSSIYSDNRIVSDRTIDSHVKKLRQKLKTLDADTEYVHSVYGIGYKFEISD